MNNNHTLSLSNQFLIAMPHLSNSEFSQSLVYIVTHGADGAMGLIVNQPKSLHLVDVLEQLQPDTTFSGGNLMLPIYHGGPLEPERGFVLHPKGLEFEGTVELAELNITSSQDILFHLVEKGMPEKSFIALGYASWKTGQLEKELLDNVWLTCPYQADILFEISSEQRLSMALAQLGVASMTLLSPQAGRA